MIETLSPFSRRLIAIGSLLLAILTLLNLVLVPLWQWNVDNLDELAAARMRLARMRAAVAADPPAKGDAVPATAMILAPTREAAVATLTAAIQASAARVGVTPQVVGPAPSLRGKEMKMVVNINASGSETALVDLLADIESNSPAIRLERWAIVAGDTADSPAHLEARAVALWAARP